MKLTNDTHEALRGLSATTELLVLPLDVDLPMPRYAIISDVGPSSVCRPSVVIP